VSSSGVSEFIPLPGLPPFFGGTDPRYALLCAERSVGVVENWPWILAAAAAVATGLAWVIGGPPQVAVHVPENVVQEVADQAAPAIEGVQAAALLLQEEAKAIERSNEAVRRMANFVTATAVAAVLLLILTSLLTHRQVSRLSGLVGRWLEIEEHRSARFQELMEQMALSTQSQPPSSSPSPSRSPDGNGSEPLSTPKFRPWS